jgi:sterol desaturase/sphingolipid hydroxylase (fatty acid hydroxylase superfamily)
MIIDWWKRIHDHYKGDPGKITLLTIVMLVISDLPLYFFTMLDVLKLPALYKYRLHYAKDVAGHLGNRVYPPLSVIKETLKTGEFNFIFAYVIPGYLAIKLANKLKIFVYDTDREVSMKRIVKETVLISLLADICFYLVHRVVHRPGLYQFFHKKHHEFKYSMALAHHYMEYHEAVMFALPQALPPMMLMPFFGRMHIVSMWAGMFFTQFGAILGHAGYNFTKLPEWMPVFRPAYHDFHHVDYSVNFGANFEFTDRLFGTLARAPLATAKEAFERMTTEKAYDYVKHAISTT